MDWVQTKTSGAMVAVDPSIGNIRRLKFCIGGRTLSPLHTAPWADDPKLRENGTVLPVEAQLAGDFFCAPFGAADLDGSPAHGWTANSPWRLLDAERGKLRFALNRPVMGACVTKTLLLAEDAPILYQSHEITGGDGQLTLAHHPMIHLAGRATLSTSPKRAAITPETPLVPERHRLALGQRVTDVSNFPAVDGSAVDLFDLPIADRHEDFVTFVEANRDGLGWTAVVRDAEDDIVFVLKDPSILPVTMFWHSNGGRDYAPWSGRHRGVLGIEDGCAAGVAGHRDALAPNPISAEGVPTALALGPPVRIALVIGAVPKPDGWTCIKQIVAAQGQITLTDAGGAAFSLPFDTEFLRKEP